MWTLVKLLKTVWINKYFMFEHSNTLNFIDSGVMLLVQTHVVNTSIPFVILRLEAFFLYIWSVLCLYLEVSTVEFITSKIWIWMWIKCLSINGCKRLLCSIPKRIRMIFLVMTMIHQFIRLVIRSWKLYIDTIFLPWKKHWFC